MKRKRSDKLNCIKHMPPRFHTLPGQEFDIRKSEVVKWIISQPDVLNWLINYIRATGYLKYDPLTKKWSGINYDA